MNHLHIRSPMTDDERFIIVTVFETVTRELNLDGVTVTVEPLETWRRDTAFGWAQGSYTTCLRHDRSLYQMALTLAHELRHNWQHRTGRLQRVGLSYYWQGKPGGEDACEDDAEAYARKMVHPIYNRNAEIFNRFKR